MEGTTLRGALPRGLGLSLEKAQTKEHQGAAAPWTPGEGEGPRSRSSDFGLGYRRGGRGFMTHGGLSTDLVLLRI